MPLVYTKEEIKQYLAGRGFDISDEDRINKFIHDLKKMIKFEDRQRRRVKLGHNPQETNLESTGHSGRNVTDHSVSPSKGPRSSTKGKPVSRVDDEEMDEDVAGPSFPLQPLHPKKEGEIRKNTDSKTDHKHSKTNLRPKTAPAGSKKGTICQSLSVLPPECEYPTGVDDTDDMLFILDKLLGNCGYDETENESVTTRKTISGPSNAVKRDPVRLYHYYKKIWDKQPIPGQDRHMQLRWNVRAYTVGNYPCVDGRPVKYLR